MTEKIPRIRKILFYMALTIELLLVIVDKSAVTNPYVSYFFRVTFLLTLAVVLLSQYTRREWIVLLVLTAISVVKFAHVGTAGAFLDRLLGIATCLFLVSAITSFASIRRVSAQRRLESAAEAVFLVALVLVTVAALGMAFELH